MATSVPTDGDQAGPGERADRPVSHRAVGRFAGRSAAGLLSLLLGALVLAGLLYAVSDLVVAVDHAVAAGLNALVAPRPTVVAVLQGLTLAGDTITGAVVLTTLALYLLARRRPRLAAFVGVTGFGAVVLGPAVKELVGRVRPMTDVPVASAPGPSFPSGHTLTATVLTGVLLLVLLPAAPASARRPLLVGGAVLVVTVAVTRVALGVHYVSDVVGGVVLGIGWLAVTASAFRDWRREDGLATPALRRGLEPEAGPALSPAPDPEPTGVAPATVAARLLVALVLLLGTMIGTGLLLTRVLPGTALERADAGSVRGLAAQRTAPLDVISGPVDELGNTGVVIGLGLVAAVLAVAVWRRWRPAVLIAVALLGELAIFMVAATVVARPRPPVAPLDTELPPTSSFPSGHTAAAICLYGAIAALVLAGTRAWWRWLVLALAVAIVVAVALARLYRGAHFPTDVIGSVLFAVPWLLITLRLLPPGPAERGTA